MKQETFKLTIISAQNGYMVYVNEDTSKDTFRPVPYVFETMETLLKFVRSNFEPEQNTVDMLKEIHRKTPII